MTEEIPTVSVIIPTYNRAHLIDRSVRSVLAQTYRDFEIIIVDDGSTDNTEEILESLNDKRIKYIRHSENKGHSAARNTGIKAAKGRYIAFQDSDDEWLSEKLLKQIDAFKMTPLEIGVVYTGFHLIRNNKKTYIPSPKIVHKEGNIFNNLLKKNFVTPQAALVKRECFEKAGMFDESLTRLVDWELFIRISRYYQFKYIDEPLVILYYTQDSISANTSTLKTREVILSKYFDDIRRDRKLLAEHHFHIGTAAYANGEINQGRIYLIKAVKMYPLNIKYLGVALASLPGQRTYNAVASSYRKIRGLLSK